VIVGLSEESEVGRVSFLRGRKAMDIIEEWQTQWKHTHFTAGKTVKNFTKLPVRLVGTKFQTDVWREIMHIARGKVASYSEVARRIKKPGAARAVGTACGSNILAYIVPCHRVVSANGIGGYGPGGLDTKRALLAAEGVTHYAIKGH